MMVFKISVVDCICIVETLIVQANVIRDTAKICHSVLCQISAERIDAVGFF